MCDLARPGHASFALRLEHAEPSRPTLLLINPSIIPTFRCGSCPWIHDPFRSLVFPIGTTDVQGNASVPLPIPAGGGTFGFQFAYLPLTGPGCPTLGVSFRVHASSSPVEPEGSAIANAIANNVCQGTAAVSLAGERTNMQALAMLSPSCQLRMRLSYSSRNKLQRYICLAGQKQNGGRACQDFGGRRLEQRVKQLLLRRSNHSVSRR